METLDKMYDLGKFEGQGEMQKMIDYYKGQQGALRYIADISLDYDNAESVETLKEIIDEIREEALKALKLEDNYGVEGVTPEELIRKGGLIKK